MRHMMTLSVFLLALAGCKATPGAESPAPGGGEAAARPAQLDPERITRLEFYGGRCVGEPSSDGIDGVTGVELEVGKSPKWRTWSKQRVSPHWRGVWSCEVLSPEGTQLGLHVFQVGG